MYRKLFIVMTAALLNLPFAAFANDTLVSPDDVQVITQEMSAKHEPAASIIKTACAADGECFEYEIMYTTSGLGSLIFPGGWVAFWYKPDEQDQGNKGSIDSRLIDVNGDGYRDIRMDRITFTYNKVTGCFEPPFETKFAMHFSRTWCEGQEHLPVSRVL